LTFIPTSQAMFHTGAWPGCWVAQKEVSMFQLLLLGIVLLIPAALGMVLVRGLFLAGLTVLSMAAVFIMGIGALALVIAVASFFGLVEVLGDDNVGWAISLSIVIGLWIAFSLVRAGKNEVVTKVRHWLGR